MEPRVIKIFDTTLRDGEQTPGVALAASEKLELAAALAKLNVDVIEAGFPAASPGDYKAVQKIAGETQGPVIAALARADPKDITVAVQALQKARYSRIHTFIATSDIHMRYKLKMNREQVLHKAEQAVRFAKKYIESVEFSAEDASRSDREFLCQVYEKVIEAGATVINIPDTVGYATPAEFGSLVKYIRENVPNIHKADISVHCHNDLGMAVANALAAIENGADQVECTINGLGERAGNSSLEELVMALYTRQDYYQATTGIDLPKIYRTSRLVSALTGVILPPNKAIVGDNAFAHESGIHQHGIINNASTYEIMRPEIIGVCQNSLVLGKHSGKHGFAERLKGLGYDLDNETIACLFEKFKELADQKKNVYDRDIEALLNEHQSISADSFSLLYHHIVSGMQTLATATIRLQCEGGIVEQASCGNGPVEATFKALEQAVGLPIVLKDYQLKAVTTGGDALGEATVRIEYKQTFFVGRGLSTDIIEASAKAYLNAINKLQTVNGYRENRNKIGGD